MSFGRLQGRKTSVFQVNRRTSSLGWHWMDEGEEGDKDAEEDRESQHGSCCARQVWNGRSDFKLAM